VDNGTLINSQSNKVHRLLLVIILLQGFATYGISLPRLWLLWYTTNGATRWWIY